MLFLLFHQEAASTAQSELRAEREAAAAAREAAELAQGAAAALETKLAAQRAQAEEAGRKVRRPAVVRHCSQACWATLCKACTTRLSWRSTEAGAHALFGAGK